MTVAPGETSKSWVVRVLDDTGAGVTGLVAATFPSMLYCIAGVSSAAVSISLSDLAALNSAYSSGGVKEMGGGNYRFDVPNAAIASAAPVAVWGEATGKRIDIVGNADVRYVQSDIMQAGHTATTQTAGMLAVNSTQFNGNTYSGAFVPIDPKTIGEIRGEPSTVVCNFSTGNDSTGNGTAQAPYKTLSKGNSIVGAGGTVIMLANETATDTATTLACNVIAIGTTFAATFTTTPPGTALTMGAGSTFTGLTVTSTLQFFGGGADVSALSSGANCRLNNCVVVATNQDSGNVTGFGAGANNTVYGLSTSVTASGGGGTVTRVSGSFGRLEGGLTATTPWVGWTVVDPAQANAAKIGGQTVTATGAMTFAGGGFGWSFGTRALTDKTGFTATASSLAAQAQTDVQTAMTAQGFTSGRAGYIDNLNIGGAVGSSTQAAAIQLAVNNLNNLSALATIHGSPAMEVPASGSIAYPLTMLVKDAEGHLLDLSTSPTVTAANAAGTDRSANLSAVSHPSTGQYTFTYTVVAGATQEGLSIKGTGTAASDSTSRIAIFGSAVVSIDTVTAITAIKVQTDKIGTTAADSSNITGIKVKTDTIGTNAGDSPNTVTEQATIAALPSASTIATTVRDVNNTSPAANSLGAKVNTAAAGGGGGGGGGGSGIIAVNENTGGTDNLRAVDGSGNGIDGATVLAIVAENYDSGSYGASGEATTKADGRWLNPMMLDPGSYAFVFSKPGSNRTEIVRQAVS